MHVFPTLLSASLLCLSAMASNPEQIAIQQPEYTPQITIMPTLADLLTIEPSVSIFYSYARELEMSRILSDENSKITLFAPTNKAIMALSRKPHEGPETGDEIEVSEEVYHRRTKNFVQRWISAHIVSESPFDFSSAKPHRTLLGDKSITCSLRTGAGSDWSRAKLDGNVRVISKKDALNGELYLIDGAIATE